jgi:hypothetical protein
VNAEPAAAGLHWSIKRAFVSYVARMADGQILGSPGLGMSDSSTFVWPPASGREQNSGAPTTLAFEGAVIFGAHGGALSFRVAEPLVELSPGRSQLTIAGEGSTRIAFVDFVARRVPSAADMTVWAGTDVRLAEAALPLFSGYYGAGESFDDLLIVLTPSSEA